MSKLIYVQCTFISVHIFVHKYSTFVYYTLIYEHLCTGVSTAPLAALHTMTDMKPSRLGQPSPSPPPTSPSSPVQVCMCLCKSICVCVNFCMCYIHTHNKLHRTPRLHLCMSLQETFKVLNEMRIYSHSYLLVIF